MAITSSEFHQGLAQLLYLDLGHFKPFLRLCKVSRKAPQQVLGVFQCPSHRGYRRMARLAGVCVKFCHGHHLATTLAAELASISAERRNRRPGRRLVESYLRRHWLKVMSRSERARTPAKAVAKTQARRRQDPGPR
jgi:hypothetical protein